MISNNYFTDDEDLVLIFDKLIDWNSVVEGTEGNDFYDHQVFQKTGNQRYEMSPSSVEEAIDLYRSSMESLGDFFGKEVSQFSRSIDKNHLIFKNSTVIFPKETIEI